MGSSHRAGVEIVPEGFPVHSLVGGADEVAILLSRQAGALAFPL